MNRFVGRFTKAITRPWKMYPLGLLFGLGFDTAIEVALIFLAAGVAEAGLPFDPILCLPILFAAGVPLLDTIDGSFMNFAYGWAFAQPVRKVFYNIAIAGLSVAVAAVVGTSSSWAVLARKLNAHGSFWAWVEHININALVSSSSHFRGTWIIALAIWRVGPSKSAGQRDWTATSDRGRLACFRHAASAL